MSTLSILKQKREERKNLADQTGTLLTKAHNEGRSLTAEENQEWDKRMAAVDANAKEIERLEKQLEIESHLTGTDDKRSAGREDTAELERRNAPADPAKQAAVEMRTFRRWLANGYSGLNTEERSIAKLDTNIPDEVRALSGATGSAGAYTIPQGFQNTLDEALKQYGGVLAAADYIDTTSGSTLPYPTEDDTSNTGELLAENTAAATNQDPTFGTVSFAAYMLSSGIVKVPIQLLDDSAFNIDTHLQGILPVRIGRKLSAYATTGTGSSQPQGIVTGASAGVTAASATAITYNELLTLFHSVDPAYRAAALGAGWMFNDSTLLAIRKLVDSNGRPLFIAGGALAGADAGVPDKIMDLPFFVNQDMASMTTGNKTVIFGALKKFKIRRVKQMQVVRFAERYMDALQIGVLAFQRFDSHLINTAAVKYLVQA